MKNHGVCCDHCFHQVAKKSSSAAKIWFDLCKSVNNSAYSIVIAEESKEIKLLENLGLIVTTELQIDHEPLDFVVLKLHTKSLEDEYVYCGMNCYEF